MEPKTTKRDYCKTFYAKRESVMRIPKLYVFGSICYALQPSKLLHKLEERSAKGLWILLATKFWIYKAKLLM